MLVLKENVYSYIHNIWIEHNMLAQEIYTVYAVAHFCDFYYVSKYIIQVYVLILSLVTTYMKQEANML